MKIAVLAVQGAFIEHIQLLEKLGAKCIELRKKEDLKQGFDGLVLPGGESTVQEKLLKELGMFDVLKKKIQTGLPVLGTCAGLILLSTHFLTLPVKVKRNAYGRQLGSFSYSGKVAGIWEENKEFPLEFIRAPYIEEINDSLVESMVVIDKMPDKTLGKNVVGVRYKNQIALAFHPELTEDTRIHELFLSLCR